MPLTNSQYDSFIRFYEKTRMANKHLEELRFQEVCEQIPKYQELDQKLSSLRVQKLRSFLSEDLNAFQNEQIDQEIECISKEKTDLLTSHGFPIDYLAPIYLCSDCKDTGYIDREKCHCFKQAQIKLLYQQSNIHKVIQQDNFSSLSHSFYQGEDLNRFIQAEQAAKKFVSDFNLDYQNLFFYGTVGTGKSFLSGCIAKELLDQGYSVLYFSAASLFEQISKFTFDYKSKENSSHLLHDLYHCDLLIIDDLGTELTNSFVSSSFFTCINERHIRKCATVISTNLSLEELSLRYSERIFSRITSHFQLYKLTGPDIRMHQKRTANRK